MQIPQEDLDEFKQIYREEFGEEPSEIEASEMANNLLDLYKLLMQPLPGEDGPPAVGSSVIAAT